MSQTATVYAQALYSLAREEHLEENILHQMEAICQAVEQEPDFLRLLSAANLSKQERCDILDNSFRGRIEQYLLNFLKILTQKNYIRQLPRCLQAYREQYHADYGILPVTAVTAVAMTDVQLQKLTDKLQSMTGKTIALTNRIDPAVMGGVRLSYDGKQVDGTVQSRLEAVSKLLKNTVL